jgi:hypothetical protein
MTDPLECSFRTQVLSLYRGGGPCHTDFFPVVIAVAGRLSLFNPALATRRRGPFQAARGEAQTTGSLGLPFNHSWLPNSNGDRGR